MAGLTLNELWLFCRLAERLLLRPASARSYGALLVAVRGDLERLRRDGRPVPWIVVEQRATLRRLVERIEKSMDRGPLVERDGRGRPWTLTTKGRDIHKIFQTMLDAIGTDAPAPPAAPLRVRVADSIAAEVLPGAVGRFLAAAPDAAAPSFRRMDYDRMARNLLDDEFHLGLGYRVEGYDFTGVAREPLEPERPLSLALLSPPDQPFRDTDFEGDRLFFVLQADLKMPGVDAFLRRVRRAGDRVVEAVNFQAVLTHVRRDHGYGIVPYFPWVLDPLRQKGKLDFELLEEAPPQFITLYLPLRGEAALPPVARAFLAAVRRNVAELYGGTGERPRTPPVGAATDSSR